MILFFDLSILFFSFFSSLSYFSLQVPFCSSLLTFSNPFYKMGDYKLDNKISVKDGFFLLLLERVERVLKKQKRMKFKRIN